MCTCAVEFYTYPKKYRRIPNLILNNIFGGLISVGGGGATYTGVIENNSEQKLAYTKVTEKCRKHLVEVLKSRVNMKYID